MQRRCGAKSNFFDRRKRFIFHMILKGKHSPFRVGKKFFLKKNEKKGIKIW